MQFDEGGHEPLSQICGPANDEVSASEVAFAVDSDDVASVGAAQWTRARAKTARDEARMDVRIEGSFR
jgi:hypothetical protein